MAGATTIVAIGDIYDQINNCDSIVADIDNIVPKLYKIRQQVLAQKEYISDITEVILKNINIINANILTLNTGTDILGDNVISAYKNALDADGAVGNLDVILSLFKFKHELGTTKHFTTDQMELDDNPNVRRKGFNLIDVKNLINTLNTLLSLSNTGAQFDAGPLLIIPRTFPDPPSAVTSADTTTSNPATLPATLVAEDYLGFGLS